MTHQVYCFAHQVYLLSLNACIMTHQVYCFAHQVYLLSLNVCIMTHQVYCSAHQVHLLSLNVCIMTHQVYCFAHHVYLLSLNACILLNYACKTVSTHSPQTAKKAAPTGTAYIQTPPYHPKKKYSFGCIVLYFITIN